MNKDIYDIAIIGGGVCGTALLYTLSNYTNVDRIALIEKNSAVALVNSRKSNNSQTLHFGDIETNYSLEKARKVKQAASLVKNYLLHNDPQKKAYTKYHKMVLAVGEEQAAKLRRRYTEFKELFPALKLIDRNKIAKIEPKVLQQRDTDEDILGLFTEEGYTINFQNLSESFLNLSFENTEKNIETFFNCKVIKIVKEDDKYLIKTAQKTLVAKAIAVEAGAHSLLFAKSLGYGRDYALLSVAGSFYFAPKMLKGKVYTVQLKKA